MEKVTFYKQVKGVNNKWVQKQLQGYRAFDYGKARLIVHRHPIDGKWDITEEQTGLGIGLILSDNTRQDAIADARSILDKHGIEKVNHAIDSALNK